VRWSLLLAVVLGLVGAGMLVSRESPVEDPIWWYTNEQPPRITIQGPTGPLRGATQASITLQPADRAHVVAVSLDGVARTPSAAAITIDTSVLSDGMHRLEVVARDTSRRQNEASAAWMFSSDNSAPRIDVELDPSEGPVEGRTFTLRIRIDERPHDLQARFDQRPLQLHTDGSGGYWAIDGLAPDTPHERIALWLRATDALGNANTVEREWGVRRTEFPEEDLGIEPTAAQREAREVEERTLLAIYARPNGPKRWDGRFRSPVEGEITTEFGTRRSYEYHQGTDFAAPRGAPLRAPANGVVVFADTVPARGNTLVLDHGAGVYTTYGHLDAFEVDEGAQVRAGDTIARIGTTGFSTGPHLHWELWVNGANVDPLEWTRRTFP
jgi:hypothetical protein